MIALVAFALWLGCARRMRDAPELGDPWFQDWLRPPRT